MAILKRGQVEYLHRPPCGGQNPHENVERGRLSRAVGSQQAKYLTGTNTKRKIIERRDFFIPFGEVIDNDQILGQGHRPVVWFTSKMPALPGQMERASTDNGDT